METIKHLDEAALDRIQEAAAPESVKEVRVSRKSDGRPVLTVRMARLEADGERFDPCPCFYDGDGRPLLDYRLGRFSYEGAEPHVGMAVVGSWERVLAHVGKYRGQETEITIVPGE